MGNPVTGRLRELAERAELAYREYGLGKCPDDQMFEAREQFEEVASPEVVLALCDVAEAARRFVADREHASRTEGMPRPNVAGGPLDRLRLALARLSAAEELPVTTEERQAK